MLDEKFIPTPLIAREERQQLVIERQLRVRFRTLYLISQLCRLTAYAAWLKLTGQTTTQTLGDLLSEFCQKMGVLWIKVAQLFSMRADLLSPEVCEALTRLQDQARGFPPELALQTVEEDLGPVGAYFSEFDKNPFAAASICQVHRARLRREGVTVAVKIRRPHVEKTFAGDMRVIRGIAWIAQRFSILPHFRWKALVWELEQLMREELDYHNEATNMRRMRKTLKAHNVYVPKVFARYTTPRMLVMEFLDGVPMSDYLAVLREDPQRAARWIAENAIEPARLARRIQHSHLRQSLEDNLYHCDLHPGNIVLLRDSRFGLIDFGSVASADADFLRKYDLYLEACGTGQYAKLLDIYFMFADELPLRDLSKLKQKMIRRLQTWETRCRVEELPYLDKSISAMNDELVRLVGEYKISMIWSFLRLTRAWYTMDASIRELAPDGNFHKMVSDYFEKKRRRERARLLSAPWPRGEDYRRILEAPIVAHEREIFRRPVIRRLAQTIERTATSMSAFVGAIFGLIAASLSAAGVLLFFVFVRQYLPGWSVSWPVLQGAPRLDVQVWILLFFILGYSINTFWMLRNRFRTSEIPQ